MTIKRDSLGLLKAIGIGKKHALAIAGQSGTPTGRKGNGWQQLCFDGGLIGRAEPFVFCIPNEAISL